MIIAKKHVENNELKNLTKRNNTLGRVDEKIISFYSHGLSASDIQDELEKIYGEPVSSNIIIDAIDCIITDVRVWQTSPLDYCFPIVYFGSIFVKVKNDKVIRNTSVYYALGINAFGYKELLGTWISQNEKEKPWLTIFSELKNRGLDEIFLACVDELADFPEALKIAYPQAKFQLSISHKIRQSFTYVHWKDEKILSKNLEAIYSAKLLLEAEAALDDFSAKWDAKYPYISAIWRRDWQHITAFFDLPFAIRKAVYKEKVIGLLNTGLQKVIKNKRLFLSNEDVLSVIYLAYGHISRRWTRPLYNWKPAMGWFLFEFGDRITM